MSEALATAAAGSVRRLTEGDYYECENCRCVCTRAKEYHSHKIRTLMPTELSFISIVSLGRTAATRPGGHAESCGSVRTAGIKYIKYYSPRIVDEDEDRGELVCKK